jgi:hypothetical protein
MKIFVLLALITAIVGVSHWPTSMTINVMWPRGGRAKNNTRAHPDSVPA